MRDIINQVLKKELSEQEENLNDNPDPNEVDRRSYDRQIYIYLWDNTKNDISSACTATTGISLYVGLTVDEDKRYKAHIKNFKSAREGQQVRGGDAKQKSAVERFINRCRVKNKMRFDAYRPIYPKRITAEQAKSDELCLIQGFKREENENLNVLNVHQQTSSLGGCTRFTRSVIYDVTHYELMGNQGAVLPPAILNYYTKKDMKAAFDLGAENKFFLEDHYSFDELLNKVGELNDLNDYRSFLTRIKKDKGYHKRSDLTKLIENLGILFPKNIENKVYVVTSDLSRTYDSLYDAVNALGENNRSYLSDNLRDNFEEFYRQRDLSKKIKFNSNRTIALIPKYRLSNFTFKPGDDLLGSVDTKIDRFFREREQQLVTNLNETQKIIKKILQEETSDRAKEKLVKSYFSKSENVGYVKNDDIPYFESNSLNENSNPVKNFWFKKWTKQKEKGENPSIYDIEKLGFSNKRNEIVQYFVDFMGYGDGNTRSNAIKQYLLNHTFTEKEITEMDNFDQGKIQIRFNKVQFLESQNNYGKNFLDLDCEFVVLSGSFYNSEEGETYNFSSGDNPFDDFVTYFEFKEEIEQVVESFVHKVVELFGFNINNDFDYISVKW